MWKPLFFVPLFLSSCASVKSVEQSSLDCILSEIRTNKFNGEYSYTTTDESFQNVTDVDNGRCSVDPLIILWPSCADDVVVGVAASRTCETKLSVISGGHSAACFSLTDQGITMSLSAMNSIQPDFTTGQIKVQAGAIFKDVYTAVFDISADANNTRWTPIGGGCPYVGVGGFFLGGGWSFLSRSYGLAADMMLGMDVVLADGSLVHANASDACQNNLQCRELWWASRGGGGGNFGIVTEYHFQMRISPKEILVGQLCWAYDTPVLGQVWGWLIDVYPSLPDWIQIDSGWLPLGQDGSRLFCHTVICNNPSEDACMAILQPVIDVGGVVLNDMEMQPYLTWQINHDSITSAQHGQLYLTNVMMEEGVLSAARMLVIQQAIMAAPSDRNLVITHMGGGALSRVSASATSFPHRSSQFVVQIKAIWSEDDNTSVANIAWVDELKAYLTPLSTGSYVNYMDPYLEGFAEKYYKDNLPRLQQVKKLLDPEYVFNFKQAITY
jgi:hypothetical protein